MTLISKPIKKDKNKIHISSLNNSQLLEFLNYIDVKQSNGIKGTINKDQIIHKFEEIINNYNICDKQELGHINFYLRKNVCVKLYKSFSFLFKKYKINENKIKQFCIYIEKKARIVDFEMGTQYKEYIIKILKKLSMYS